jgi:hypothetical protein
MAKVATALSRFNDMFQPVLLVQAPENHRAFSEEVDTGSSKENATKQEERARF